MKGIFYEKLNQKLVGKMFVGKFYPWITFYNHKFIGNYWRKISLIINITINKVVAL